VAGAGAGTAAGALAADSSNLAQAGVAQAAKAFFLNMKLLERQALDVKLMDLNAKLMALNAKIAKVSEDTEECELADGLAEQGFTIFADEVVMKKSAAGKTL
jgi:hypothetical protein